MWVYEYNYQVGAVSLVSLVTTMARMVDGSERYPYKQR